MRRPKVNGRRCPAKWQNKLRSVEQEGTGIEGKRRREHKSSCPRPIVRFSLGLHQGSRLQLCYCPLTVFSRLLCLYQWATWTSVLGSSMTGVWPAGSDVTDVNACSRTRDKQVLRRRQTATRPPRLVTHPPRFPLTLRHCSCQLWSLLDCCLSLSAERFFAFFLLSLPPHLQPTSRAVGACNGRRLWPCQAV